MTEGASYLICSATGSGDPSPGEGWRRRKSDAEVAGRLPGDLSTGLASSRSLTRSETPWPPATSALDTATGMGSGSASSRMIVSASEGYSLSYLSQLRQTALRLFLT